MHKDREQITRREFIDHVAMAGAGVTAIAAGAANVASAAAKKRIALVGTGIRGTTMWGAGVARPYGELVEMVNLVIISLGNELRTQKRPIDHNHYSRKESRI